MERIWTPALSVQDAELDEQHKSLIEKANEIIVKAKDAQTHEGEESVLSKQEIEGLINFLEEYARKHFACEEGKMRRCGFAGIDGQRSAHVEFMMNAANLRKRFIAGESNEALIKDIRQYVSGWIINHIAGLDKEYAGKLQ